MKYKKIIIAGALLATTMSCGKNNDDATTSASSEENNEQGTAGASKKAGALKSDFEKKFKELELALASVVVKDDQLPVYTITDKYVKAKEGETNTKYGFDAVEKFIESEDLPFAQDAITCIARTAFFTVSSALNNESKTDGFQLSTMLCAYDKDKTSKDLTVGNLTVGSVNLARFMNTHEEYVTEQYHRLLLRTISGDTRNVNKLVAQIKTSNDKEALKQLGDSLTVEKLIPGTCKLTSKDLKMYPDKPLEHFMSRTMLDSYIESNNSETDRNSSVSDFCDNNNVKQSGYVGDGGFGYVSSRNNQLPALVENTYKSYDASFKYVIRLMKEAISARIKIIDEKSTKAGSKQ